MRIALVAESFFPAVDGTTTTVKAVVDRLVDTGHDVLVVAPAPGLTTYRGCRVARIQPRELVGTQVRAALEAFRPDLVHVTSPDTVGRKALKHARRLGIPHAHRAADARLPPGRRAVADQGRRALRPGARDRRLDARAAGRPRGRGRPVGAGRRHRRVRPAAARPVAARQLGQGQVEARTRASSSGTSAACTGGTASARSASWPRCPASGRCSSATARRRPGSGPACRTPSSPAPSRPAT